MPEKIVLVGRPNVGKSTLFNRLVGKRMAIVDDTPGVTRDRRQGLVRRGGMKFILVDTPGLEEARDDELAGRMRLQTEQAVAGACVCLFLVDARSGIVPADHVFADMLRSAGKPVILVANKCEGVAGTDGLYDSYALGLGEPVAISAEHGEGMAGLYHALESMPGATTMLSGDTTAGGEAGTPLKPLRLAIVGRPNVGKSTLVNRMIGQDRLLTGPEAGITRDSVNVEWVWKARDRDWVVGFYDTAGLRKKARVQSRLERLSVSDTLRAIRFAEVVVLLTDIGDPFGKQDRKIFDMTFREGRALVAGVNKLDLAPDPEAVMREIRAGIPALFPQAPGLPVLPLSGLTGAGLDTLMPAVTGVYTDWNARVKTPDLNVWLREAVSGHAPPAVSGRRAKLRYIAQTKTRPPTFVLQCTRADALPESYRRYLVNGIREAFGIGAVPVRLVIKKPGNPYADGKETARGRRRD